VWCPEEAVQYGMEVPGPAAPTAVSAVVRCGTAPHEFGQLALG